jgi:hypothetical protein
MLARLLILARDKLTRAEAIIVAAVERHVPPAVAPRDAVDAFHRLLRGRDAAALGPWIEAALASPVASFAKGVIADRAAVAAAIETPWSNGQTEGSICKLKTLKRQMGGRANLDLLPARMMPVAGHTAPRLRQAHFSEPINNPETDVAAPYEPTVLFRPIRHPRTRLRDVMALRFMVAIRHCSGAQNGRLSPSTTRGKGVLQRPRKEQRL